MNRRAFLGAIGATAAALALDPDLALWTPGAKRIFLPAAKPSLWTPTALQRGDIFTIEGISAVHPWSYRNTGHPQQFVVTADVASGPLAMSDICPQMVFDGGYMNVAGVLTPNAQIRPLLWESHAA